MTANPSVANRMTERIRSINYKKLGYDVGSAAISIGIAVLIGALLLLVNGRNPLEAYQSLLYGAFGTVGRFTETLVKATPFLLMAIAVSVSFRCQVWNIGVEGQFMIGAIFSTWVALNFVALPPILLVPLTFVAAIIGGALWSGIAGVLKAHMNVNEVITTSMLNYIAFYLVSFLVSGPMMDPRVSTSHSRRSFQRRCSCRVWWLELASTRPSWWRWRWWWRPCSSGAVPWASHQGGGGQPPGGSLCGPQRQAHLYPGVLDHRRDCRYRRMGRDFWNPLPADRRDFARHGLAGHCGGAAG
jgi:hypothetical protein